MMTMMMMMMTTTIIAICMNLPDRYLREAIQGGKKCPKTRPPWI